jgi:primosomal protein N' (replication factor Y)
VKTVRVLPDVSGLNRAFDYYVPDDLDGPPIQVGTIVRIVLHGRRTAGWVVGVDMDPPEGVTLEPILKSSSVGPGEEVVELAQWVASEWAGRWSAVLTTASPEPFVRSVPARVSKDVSVGPASGLDVLFDGEGPRIVRSAPASDRFEIVREAARRGPAIVVAPDLKTAGAYAGRLRRAGVRTHRYPEDWAGGFEGGVVLGARSTVFATVADLASIVVIDEHDDALANERNPTWHARDVAIERSRRANIPCLLVSAVPSLAALTSTSDVRLPDRNTERAGWPRMHVVDRRDEDPGRAGLFSVPLIRRIRSDGRVLCILNRKGRAVMLACASCGELVRSQSGDELMVEDDEGLIANRSGEQRPRICLACSGTKLKRLRLGVSRAAEELSILLREPVGEVTGSSAGGEGLDHRVVVGTEALLHRVAVAETVAFLDFDNELLGSRYRAAAQAMTLLLRAATIVGSRTAGGTVLVQTRMPDHRVLRAASRAQPDIFTSEELDLRARAGLPPHGGLALIKGAGSEQFVAPLEGRLDLEVVGPDRDGNMLVKGPDRRSVAHALSTLPRPKQSRVSVWVDPVRA